MYTRLSFIFLILVVSFSSCKKEDSDFGINCTDDINAAKNTLQNLDQENVLILNIEDTGTHFQLNYENGSTQNLSKDCVRSVTEDAEEWTANVLFHDNDELALGFVGDLAVSYRLNPTGFSPLTARLDVYSPRKGKIKLRVAGKNGPLSDVCHNFEAYDTRHIVPILGLYPGHNNQIEFSFTDKNGIERKTESLELFTSELPEGYPEIIIDVRNEAMMDGHFTLVSNRSVINSHNRPFIFDAFGDVRWYLDYTNHLTLNQLGYDVGIERLANGNFYFGDWSTRHIYEIDVYGVIVNSWQLPDAGFHHNVQEKPDGNFLVTVNRWGEMHDNGNYAVEDVIYEIDRNSGTLVQAWDLKESLDEYRTTWANNLENEYVDWFHANAVIYDPSDNTIIVSGRHQGLVKLDYNNQVQWIMAPHKEWTTNRQGQDLNQFLLTPLDAVGNPITDSDVLDGNDNHPDFEWNWYQHAPLLLPNGNILLFDNGDFRNYTLNERYSRAVEFAVNDDNRTIQQIWQYGKERGRETFSSIVSDVDYLPAKGNVLFCPGAFVNNNPDGFGAKIVEINYDTKEVVFEAKLINEGIVFHRSERLSLYSDMY